MVVYADTDGDRLEDGVEIELGTDPLLPDTDGDTYEDGDEVTEGTDPLDPASVIYTGGWPYYACKGDIRVGSDLEPDVGQRFPRLAIEDQFDERVDLYDDDYNEEGPDVFLLLCVAWGPYCDFFKQHLGS